MGGWLIVFEGIDGSGKTTQVERLAGALRALGRTVVTTREPTDGPHGRKIRDLSTRAAPMTPEEELGYFLEDRREHVREVIEPALERGEVVITDRYFLSTAAYQGARGLDPEAILVRNESLFPLPDAVVLIDLTAAAALRRVELRGANRNQAYEREEFLDRVAENFRSFERDYIRVVDGEAEPDDVHRVVREVLGDFLDPSAG